MANQDGMSEKLGDLLCTLSDSLDAIAHECGSDEMAFGIVLGAARSFYDIEPEVIKAVAAQLIADADSEQIHGLEDMN